MKGIAAVVLIGLMGLATLGITMDINSVTVRKAELEDTLTNSIWNTLKATNVYKMYEVDDQQMSAEFIQSLAETVNTDSAFDIYIYSTSTKGLMDVKVQGSFSHLNGKEGVRSTHKTLLLEKQKSNE